MEKCVRRETKVKGRFKGGWRNQQDAEILFGNDEERAGQMFGDTVREARLRWFGRVQWRNRRYVSRRMLKVELPGKWQRGKPKGTFMDMVRGHVGSWCDRS